MKTLCLVICCLTVISALPAYATKIIVNDNQDRIVYSRSTLPSETIVYEQNDGNETFNEQKYYGNKNSEQDNYQLHLLGNDFRIELAGTKWNLEENTIPVNYKIKANDNEYTARLDRIKRGSREAADYYYIDKVKAPDTLIPSGYAE